MSARTIIDRIRKDQQDKGSTICLPNANSRIGFVFSTKERVDFTRRTLAALDCEAGFDLICVDGSDSLEARELPRLYPFRNARLAEVHLDVRGGPDRAICYGLRRLLDLGYDFCGLIENDILLGPGWFSSLIGAFRCAAAEGLAVGAATVRNFTSRVLEYRENYTINWNIGAGMVLFSRRAAQIVMDEYPELKKLTTTTRQLIRFYGELCGLDLRNIADLRNGRVDRRMSPDWCYDMVLYKAGLASVGVIPSLAEELEPGASAEDRGARRVAAQMKARGTAHPALTRRSLLWLRLTGPLFALGWTILTTTPWLFRFGRSFKEYILRSKFASKLFWGDQRGTGQDA